MKRKTKLILLAYTSTPLQAQTNSWQYDKHYGKWKKQEKIDATKTMIQQKYNRTKSFLEKVETFQQHTLLSKPTTQQIRCGS